MELPEAFYDALNEKNIVLLRIYMKNSLLLDSSFKEFDEMSKLASSIEGLFDTFDGKELIKDKTLWDEEYLNKVLVELIDNFSTERILHAKDVVSYLKPVADEKETFDYRTVAKGSAVGAATGLVVGAVVVGATEAPVVGVTVGCTIAGAAIGGAAAYLINKYNKED